MNLYIITKDGKLFNGSNLKEETFVKAYFEKAMAEKIAKSFCTAEANTYYRYGQGYYDNEYVGVKARNEMAKELASVEMERWDVLEINC